MQLGAGEILGVLGPSGAGKTTLVKCLLGTLKLDGGTVEIQHTRMPNLSIMDRIGYMAQQDALYEDLTGLQNLVFFAQLKGMKKRDAIQQAHALLTLVEAGSGRKQEGRKLFRRHEAQAFAHRRADWKPRCDRARQADCRNRRSARAFLGRVRRLKTLGRSIIVTTHVMDEAEKCDRLILIRGGAILENGTPQELKGKTAQGTLEAAYIAAGGGARM